VLKHGNLDKFESRSSDGVFLGYALHSHAYHVLNLETNRIMETYEVTFNETAPCPSPVFEPIGPDQMGQTIFVEEEHNDVDWVALKPTPLATLVEPASTTTVDGPDPTPSTTWGLLEPAAAETRGVEAAVEGEATSSREAPQHIQHRHPPQQMIGELHERVTRSRSQHISHFLTQLLLLLLSSEMLDMLHLILTGLMLCMRSLKILKEIRFGF
jgi:hypothetical protein